MSKKTLLIELLCSAISQDQSRLEVAIGILYSRLCLEHDLELRPMSDRISWF